MLLVDHDPRWLIKENRRVGFVFRSPSNPRYYQSCFFAPTPKLEQFELFQKFLGGDMEDAEYGRPDIQPCKPTTSWTSTIDPEFANFDHLTVTPSLDGSPGGLWHGWIIDGELRIA